MCVAGNRIGTYGAGKIAQTLKAPNGSLQTLDLSSNYIDVGGGEALAEALRVPHGSLRTLNLSGEVGIWKTSYLRMCSSAPVHFSD